LFFLPFLSLHGGTPREGQPVTVPIRLFNGKTLAGFRTWLVDTRDADPRRVFSVTNRMIRISGDGLGYLATQEAYRDYRLIAEFRWGRTNWSWGDRIGHARDSGVFLHANGPDGNSHDGNGAFMAAIECNVFEGATGDLLLIRGGETDGKLLAPHLEAEVAPDKDTDGWFTWRPGGRTQRIETWGRLNWRKKSPAWRDTTGFRGPADVELLPGRWNRLECTCEGDRIQIRLNGLLVNEAKAVSPSAGQVLLQCEGSEIFFRRLDLEPLRRRR
jgi:hypothetical protein